MRAMEKLRVQHSLYENQGEYPLISEPVAAESHGCLSATMAGGVGNRASRERAD